MAKRKKRKSFGNSDEVISATERAMWLRKGNTKKAALELKASKSWVKSAKRLMQDGECKKALQHLFWADNAHGRYMSTRAARNGLSPRGLHGASWRTIKNAKEHFAYKCLVKR